MHPNLYPNKQTNKQTNKHTHKQTTGVVYAAASLGVVQGQEEDKDGGLKDARQRLFKGHEEQILCVAIDAARLRVATGSRPTLPRQAARQTASNSTPPDCTSLSI